MEVKRVTDGVVKTGVGRSYIVSPRPLLDHPLASVLFVSPPSQTQINVSGGLCSNKMSTREARMTGDLDFVDVGQLSVAISS